ncbi:MAG TPA: glycosyltransferase family 87 protein [Pyrinomonadaceae bacterium]|nr:glycosyltransferase family 87 protein [Pyrinomonadaceae bacterium]
MKEQTLKRAVVCLIVFLYVPFLYQQFYLRTGDNPGDFPSIYWGARLAFVEQRSPYVDGALAEAQEAVQRRVFPYLYPPPSLLAFYPFTLVGYDAAKIILLAMSHACLLVILYLFFFRIRPFEPPPERRLLAAALVTVYVLTYNPIVDNFAWGQINLVVLALVCLAWLAFKRGGHALSVAVPLSLAVLLKTYPVLLLPLLVIRKRYAAAVAVVLLLILYALASWAVLPRELWGDWARNVLPTGGYGLTPFNLGFLPVEPWNHSINGFFLFVQDRCPDLLGIPTRLITKPLTYLLAGAVGAATVGLSYLSARKGAGKATLDVEVSLYLLMMFLVAPLSWEHHFVYVLPAALFAAHFLLGGGVGRAWALTALAALFVIAWDFPRDDMYFIKGALSVVNCVKFFAAFALWCFVALRLWGILKDGRAERLAAGEV